MKIKVDFALPDMPSTIVSITVAALQETFHVQETYNEKE